MHRPSNVDDPTRLRAVLDAINGAAIRHGLTVVFPVHPRTKSVMEAHGITCGPAFIPTDPLGYLDLIRLLSSADLVFTDSGGIQEEACILRVPAITLRQNTERPETLRVGSNKLHHEPDIEQFVESMRIQMAKPRDWENPFGDGKTAVRVLDILAPYLASSL
jgi:UDP-N-acetylglucosamine 2-epimerase (non-hydrolysing)